MRISILTLTFILVFSTLSLGQIQKGTWTLDGDLFSAYPGYRDYFLHLSDFNLQSEGSYFITKNINVGAEIGVNHYKWLAFHYGFPDTIHQTDLTISPKFRYYLNPKHKIKLYGQLDPGLGFSIAYVNRKEEKIAGAGTYLEEGRFRTRTIHLRPNAEVGFNYFITKNIALEPATNLQFFHWEKKKSFAHGEPTDYGYLSFDETDTWTFKLGMRFFFNVEDSEQITYSPETCLRRGNLTFGIDGGYGIAIGYDTKNYTPQHSSVHISYFLFDRWSIGTSFDLVDNSWAAAIGITPSLEYYHPISPKLQIVPTLETYLGTAAASLPRGGYYGDFGSIFNLGVKANYFIGENISIWGGPFFNRNKTVISNDAEYHINLKGGFRYYMVSKKNQ